MNEQDQEGTYVMFESMKSKFNRTIQCNLRCSYIKIGEYFMLF